MATYGQMLRARDRLYVRWSGMFIVGVVGGRVRRERTSRAVARLDARIEKREEA